MKEFKKMIYRKNQIITQPPVGSCKKYQITIDQSDLDAADGNVLYLSYTNCEDSSFTISTYAYAGTFYMCAESSYTPVLYYLKNANNVLPSQSYSVERDDCDTGSPIAISVGIGGVDGQTACSNFVTALSTMYIEFGSTFLTTIYLYADAFGTVAAQAGYYSDGNNWRYWNGINFVTTDACPT